MALGGGNAVRSVTRRVFMGERERIKPEREREREREGGGHLVASLGFSRGTPRWPG
jgi:hypothetical protein